MRTIGLMYLRVRRKVCFGQKRGYLNTMADDSAILNLFETKLNMMTGNVMVILKVKFEKSMVDGWFFTNLFVFFGKQNGRQIRHFEFDFDKKQSTSQQK